jgi:hypothetical protein
VCVCVCVCVCYKEEGIHIPHKNYSINYVFGNSF